MSVEEYTIAILAIRAKIEECRHQRLWLTVNTLRHQAMTLAETFVDPTWAAEQEERPAPALRDSKAMAADVDSVCGF